MSTGHHGLNAADKASGSSPGIAFTAHGWQRVTARCISFEALEAALAFGVSQPCGGGRRRYWLGHKAVLQARRLGVELGEHQGVFVITLADGRVHTAWRNRDGLRWRRKPRTWRRRGGRR